MPGGWTGANEKGGTEVPPFPKSVRESLAALTPTQQAEAHHGHAEDGQAGRLRRGGQVRGQRAATRVDVDGGGVDQGHVAEVVRERTGEGQVQRSLGRRDEEAR